MKVRRSSENTKDPWFVSYRKYGEERIRRTYGTYDYTRALVDTLSEGEGTMWTTQRRNPAYLRS